MHRPKYDDWSFPKGKLDPGEHVTTAAVREVAEETGLDVRLGPPLPPQRYTVRNGQSRAQASCTTGPAASWAATTSRRTGPNDEVDEVAWVPLDKAAERAHLRAATARRSRSSSRSARRATRWWCCATARPSARKAWSGDDRKRPLDDDGELQAEQVVPVLGAYGVHAGAQLEQPPVLDHASAPTPTWPTSTSR